MGGHAMGRSAEEVKVAMAELEGMVGGEGRNSGILAGIEALAPALSRKGATAPSCFRSAPCWRRSRRPVSAGTPAARRPALLESGAIMLGTALIFVMLFRKLKLGATLGYIVGGALIGPHLLGLVEDPEGLASISEIGIALLLFIVGLELSPSACGASQGHLRPRPCRRSCCAGWRSACSFTLRWT